MPPPIKIRKTDEEEMERTPDGSFQLVLEISKMEECYDSYSPEIIVKGVPWRGCVWRGFGYLGAHLCCMNNQSSPWSIHVDVEYILVSSDNTNNIKLKKSPRLNNLNNRTTVRLMDWEQLIDNDKGLVTDGKITVEIRFWVSDMKGIKILPHIDFTDPNDPRHDVALVVGGEKVYASKQYLSLHSPFFHAMFYGEFAEKHKNEIELKDVDRKEFLEMLQVIYPTSKIITENSAEFLLKLGDRFQMATLIDRVEKALIDDGPDNCYLRIAEKYQLFGLQAQCLSALKTTEDFKDLEESPIFEDLSDNMKAILFSRLLKIAK